MQNFGCFCTYLNDGQENDAGDHGDQSAHPVPTLEVNQLAAAELASNGVSYLTTPLRTRRCKLEGQNKTMVICGLSIQNKPWSFPVQPMVIFSSTHGYILWYKLQTQSKTMAIQEKQLFAVWFGNEGEEEERMVCHLSSLNESILVIHKLVGLVCGIHKKMDPRRWSTRQILETTLEGTLRMRKRLFLCFALKHHQVMFLSQNSQNLQQQLRNVKVRNHHRSAKSFQCRWQWQNMYFCLNCS